MKKQLPALSLHLPAVVGGNPPQILALWGLLRSLRLLAMTPALLFFILIADPAMAKSSKSLLRGPYFLASGGVQNFTADNNVRTGAQVGRNFEPSAGFHFGWNLYDQFAPELQARYSTNKIDGNREHIATINVNAVYTAIIGEHIVPFLQAGPVIQFAAIPGDPLSTDQIIPVWNPGVSCGGGIRFLFKTYIYAGVLIQTDFISFSSTSQNISGTETTILSGGWKIEPAIEGNIGIHF